MKKLLSVLVVLLIIAVGVYLMFFNDAPEDKNANDNSGSEKGDNHVEKKFEPESDNEDANKVTFTLKDVTAADDKVKKMEYTVKNEEDEEIDVQFGSSMKYDFYITDENGEEVYRDSEGKAYMQVIEEMNLAPDEEETFELKLPELDPGDYTITIFLAAKGYSDEETSMEFTVE